MVIKEKKHLKEYFNDPNKRFIWCLILAFPVINIITCIGLSIYIGKTYCVEYGLLNFIIMFIISSYLIELLAEYVLLEDN